MKTGANYINYYDYSLLDNRSERQKIEEQLMNEIRAFTEAKQHASNIGPTFAQGRGYEQDAKLHLREIIKLMNKWK